MLSPKIIKLPDFSSFVGKIIQLEEKFIVKNWWNYESGSKFKIKKIEGPEVTLKLVSTFKESLDSILALAKTYIKHEKEDIKIFDKIIKIWTEDSEKFQEIKNTIWNEPDSQNDFKGGHCINTGYYSIPDTHPDKYGMAKRYENYPSDSIMTKDYEHIDNKKNLWSFQKGGNKWYSKATYEFIRLASLEEVKKYTLLSATPPATVLLSADSPKPQQPNAHFGTFAIRTSRHTKPKIAKEPILPPHPKKLANCLTDDKKTLLLSLIVNSRKW